MAEDLPAKPDQHIMERLEAAKHVTTKGADYWTAREIAPILGYETWRNFQTAIDRAIASCDVNGLKPDNHFVETSKLVALASDAKREVTDYFLSRAACYLIAMNGDPTKPEIASAQAYFTVQTRRMEIEDQSAKDLKRLELRDKVSNSVRKVSGAAREAGVSNKRQGIFHEQRYVGLYNASSSQVKRAKGLKDGENIMDRFGSMELSAHDFQMELAANVISKEGVRGEQAAFKRNLEVAQHVRKTIRESGGTPLENLPLDEHIKNVRKRVTGKKTKTLAGPKGSSA